MQETTFIEGLKCLDIFPCKACVYAQGKKRFEKSHENECNLHWIIFIQPRSQGTLSFSLREGERGSKERGCIFIDQSDWRT